MSAKARTEPTHAETDSEADAVTAWLLAGGEGSRMGGQDKGLVPWRGRPLAAWVLDSVAASNVHAIGITANRHIPAYQNVLSIRTTITQGGVRLAAPGGVVPDDADLPPRSGPMAGIVTALRHSSTPWVLVLPCDTPRLPPDLLPRLLAAARQAQADIAVPVTHAAHPQTGSDGTRHHWVCALMRRRLLDDAQDAFVNGERRMGRWTQSQAWVSVCFSPETDFLNMNTLETLNGSD